MLSILQPTGEPHKLHGNGVMVRAANICTYHMYNICVSDEEIAVLFMNKTRGIALAGIVLPDNTNDYSMHECSNITDTGMSADAQSHDSFVLKKRRKRRHRWH